MGRSKRKFVEILVQLLCVGLFLGFIYYLKQSSPNRDDAKLDEIKMEAVKIPVFPSFQKYADDDYTSRHMDASASLYFRSSAGLGSVRSFYDRELPKLGWEIKETGDSFYYQKNDLRLTIEYRPDQSDWNFALGIDWKNPTNYQ
ncbi:MAG: hypothetical protein AB7L70_18610 [Pyrinomonadaceae bacterium]